MATVALSHNVTRIEDFEGTPPGTFGSTGGGPGAAAEAGLHYEGSQCAARRIGGTNSDRGFSYTDTVTTDLTAAGNTVLFSKVFTALSAVINTAGTNFNVGSATNALYSYQVGDDGTMGGGKFALPPKGGYVITPIEVRKSAWHNEARIGSPDLTVTDVYEILHNVSATTGAGTSQALDAIDVTDDGLFLVGGDGTDADGTFQDFVDADEGSGLTGASRVGIWTSEFGQFFAYMTNYIGRTDAGTTTATEFTDSFFTVVFPGGFVGPGVNGLFFDLGNASTVVTLSNGTIQGGGRSDRKVYFDTELEVTGGATDQIRIRAHGLEDGDQVAYSAEGGTEDIGPDATTGEQDDATSTGVATTGDNWYVIVVDSDTIQLSNTAADAYSATPTAQNLTASGAGNGENHSLRRQPDTRPDIEFNGTSGSATLTSINLISCRDITLTSAVTLDSCQLVTTQSLTLGDATVNNCTFNQPTTPIGEAFLTATNANDLNEIDGCGFISNADGYYQGGHAIEITTSGTTAQNTCTLTDVSFSGYFAADGYEGGGWDFNANSDVNGTTNEITITSHGFTTGDPIYYSDEGGTVITGLTDQALYFVRDVGTNLVALFPTYEAAVSNTNRIGLTAGSDERHVLYSANATIYNSTGTTVTINIDGGSTPTVRNSAGSTTLVVQSVPLQLEGLTEGSYGVFIGNGGAENGNILLSGYANSSGVISGSFGGTTPQSVIVRARNAGIINAAILEDNGTGFTDYTLDARNIISPGSGSSNDVPLLPSSPALNDAFYFGGLAVFEEIEMDIDTAGTTYVLTWEYWNGAWTSLAVTDGTNSFQTAGWNRIKFTAPGDWATTTINTQGPFYYVRARVTTGGGAQPLAQSITLNKTVKYLPFNSSGTIASGTGLTATAVWQEDTINP